MIAAGMSPHTVTLMTDLDTGCRISGSYVPGRKSKKKVDCHRSTIPNSMGKVSRSSKVSKALVKKGIVKRESCAIGDIPQSLDSSVKTSLDVLTHRIASEPVSRGKRKRAMKRARLQSRDAFVRTALRAKLAADSQDGFGTALADFQEMSAAIEQELSPVESGTVREPEQKPRKPKWLSGELPRSKKLRSNQVDVERFNTLMSIPDFASDPMAAIEKHLINIKRKQEEKSRVRESMQLQ